jgi:hypothetical protein
VKLDVITKEPVAGCDISQVGNAALRTEVRREREFNDTLQLLNEENRMFGLAT